MILFLSASFLRRLKLDWKPDLKALLFGHRNLFFFTPDTLTEVSEITPETMDSFLQKTSGLEDCELLGSLSSSGGLSLPGFVQVDTGSRPDPSSWKARIFLLEDGVLRERELAITQVGRV